MIKIRNVWKRYGSLQVLKGLDLDVHDSEVLVILGRSGVGKSVLLKQIIGIETPEEGTIEINGELINNRKKRTSQKLVREMGMLFQGAALFDSMTIGDNTGFFLEEHGDPTTGKPLSVEEIRSRVAEALKMVGLAGTEHKMPSDMSGGMRKRAGLARLIVYRPKILLYDEPTTGLDPVTAMQINELILMVQAELKGISIVVTHDIRSAMEIGDRFGYHENGKIEHVAPKKDFLKIPDPRLQAFFENAILTPEVMKKTTQNRGPS